MVVGCELWVDSDDECDKGDHGGKAQLIDVDAEASAAEEHRKQERRSI